MCTSNLIFLKHLIIDKMSYKKTFIKSNLPPIKEDTLLSHEKEIKVDTIEIEQISILTNGERLCKLKIKGFPVFIVIEIDYKLYLRGIYDETHNKIRSCTEDENKLAYSVGISSM